LTLSLQQKIERTKYEVRSFEKQILENKFYYKKMATRYNSQVQKINTIAMKNCLQHSELKVTPSFDFGFTELLVQKYRQME
jgi:hypothetical protein